MSSSDETQRLQGAEGTQESLNKEKTKRSFRGILQVRRLTLVIILAAVGIVAVICYAAFSGNLDSDEMGEAASSFITQSYPAIFFFAGGFVIMRHVMFNIYRPASRYVFVTNADDQVCGLFRIPEPRFQSMKQPGNPLVFKTMGGVLIYFARYIDIENNEIGYGWCHIDKFEIVAADRALFAKIEKDFQWLLERVMYLEGHLEVESAYKARSPMSKMVEDIASRFGLRQRREYFGFDHSNVSENGTAEQEDDSGGIIR